MELHSYGGAPRYDSKPFEVTTPRTMAISFAHLGLPVRPKELQRAKYLRLPVQVPMFLLLWKCRRGHIDARLLQG